MDIHHRRALQGPEGGPRFGAQRPLAPAWQSAPGAPDPRELRTRATSALIFGIAGILLPPLGIPFGIVAIRKGSGVLEDLEISDPGVR